jgi:DNA-binding transcriptional LysR family regulator
VAHVAHSGTLSTLLDHLIAERPQLRLDERSMADERQLEAVAEQRLDLAVCTVSGPLPDGLSGCPLRRDPLVRIGDGADPLAPYYGAAWPGFDACVDGYDRTLARTSVPAGRELGALRRQACGRPIVVAESTLDGLALTGRELPAALHWQIVWRSDDPSPFVREFVTGATELAETLGWLP